MQKQFIVDENGKKIAVILPINDYNKLIDELEELEDIKLYDEAKSSDDEYVDADKAFEEIEKSRGIDV